MAQDLVKAAQTLQGFIESKLSAIQVSAAANVDVNRLVKLVLSACSKNPSLFNCSAESIFRCLQQSAEVGLEINTPLGHAYIIPRRTNGVYEATFQVGYRGYIELANRSQLISAIYCFPVFKGEHFYCQLGSDPRIDHIPNFEADRSWETLCNVYVVAKTKNGQVYVDAMGKNDVLKIKNRSKTADSGPWVTDTIEMAKKTVIRRAAKLWPLSIELATAVEYDEESELGPFEPTPSMPNPNNLKRQVIEEAAPAPLAITAGNGHSNGNGNGHSAKASTATAVEPAPAAPKTATNAPAAAPASAPVETKLEEKKEQAEEFTPDEAKVIGMAFRDRCKQYGMILGKGKLDAIKVLEYLLNVPNDSITREASVAAAKQALSLPLSEWEITADHFNPPQTKKEEAQQPAPASVSPVENAEPVQQPAPANSAKSEDPFIDEEEDFDDDDMPPPSVAPTGSGAFDH